MLGHFGLSVFNDIGLWSKYLVNVLKCREAFHSLAKVASALVYL